MKTSFIEDICCRYTLELPHRGNSNVYLQHMLLKIRKKTIWKFIFSKYHVHCLYLFKHLIQPISIKIPVTLLQIVYICMTAISMNYLFANLLVAWLYILSFNYALLNFGACSISFTSLHTGKKKIYNFLSSADICQD